MTTFRMIEGQSIPPEISLTISFIQKRLSASGASFPTLVDATAHVLDGRLQDADFILEIAPGVTMLTNFHSMARTPDFGDEQSVANRICEQAELACRDASQLEPAHLRISICARSLIENARRRGLPVDLESAHLAEFGFGTKPHDACFLITIESLGQNLRPSSMPLVVEDEDKLRLLFANVTDRIEQRVAQRNRLRGLNADGTVDLLTLNAMMHLGSPMSTLGRMLERSRMTLPEGTTLVWQDGELSSYSESGGPIKWTGDELILNDVTLPETACVKVIGRPVTDLASHFALTSDVIVRSATNEFDGMTRSVRVKLAVPLFYFNVKLGVIWPAG